mmetsp:Transcript_76976/g.135689  ORF Transcript_76976/g.135689 Transcript_76976/m.135689 type:complete len:243 (-) Transcript_76976:323-1051(-)
MASLKHQALALSCLVAVAADTACVSYGFGAMMVPTQSQSCDLVPDGTCNVDPMFSGGDKVGFTEMSCEDALQVYNAGPEAAISKAKHVAVVADTACVSYGFGAMMVPTQSESCELVPDGTCEVKSGFMGGGKVGFKSMSCEEALQVYNANPGGSISSAKSQASKLNKPLLRGAQELASLQKSMMDSSEVECPGIRCLGLLGYICGTETAYCCGDEGSQIICEAPWGCGTLPLTTLPTCLAPR